MRLVDHQVALLTRGERMFVAILTASDGTHAYGAETLSRLLSGLGRAENVR